MCSPTLLLTVTSLLTGAGLALVLLRNVKAINWSCIGPTADVVVACIDVPYIRLTKKGNAAKG